MVKIKRVRMKEEDYMGFESLVGKKKNQVKTFREIRSLAEDGLRLRKFERGLQDINEVVYGKALWKMLNKK